MSAQHSPGIWQPSKIRGTVVTDEPLPGYPGSGGHDEVEYYGGHLIAESIWRDEDMHLIAAAPELLAALEWALRAMEARNPVWAEGERFIAARAAIAKAKGEQQ